MQSVTVKGVVLRESRYKDADSLITILTAEKGIVSLLAKGLYNVTSKNRPGIQLFCYSEFEISENKGKSLVKTASLKNAFMNLRGSPVLYALACYVADTANAFCTSDNDETEAFRLVLNTLYALDASAQNGKPLWQIKAAYELKLCAVCGFAPELDGCTLCGSESGEDLVTNGKYTFSFADGSVVCGKCFSESSRDNSYRYFAKISPQTLLAARYICYSTLERFLSFKLAEESAPELEDFAEKYLCFVADRRFDTLKYYKTLSVTWKD